MSPLDIDSILDELVHQFSDPLAALRELVQNAIDAGSGEVEVFVDFDQPDDDQSRAVLTVRDWGEGMDRQIIDEKFLRLFSSNKEGDFTKVGRFGIGFVSVFALQPEKVVVDTGRSGEYWRIVFSADRTWELFKLDVPVEGTTVRVVRPMERAQFEKFRTDVRRALILWCKHPEIPVLFEGEDVRRDFDVPSKFKIRHQEEGTRVVMGMTDSEEGPVGYYNRGLTLHESRQKPWPWVTYKIDSRYLEHTLTRDQILEDSHFSKAMDLLDEFAEQKLPILLIDQLEEMAGDDGKQSRYDRCCRYLAHYLRCGREFRREWRKRTIFRLAGGEVASWKEMRRSIKDRRCHLTRLPRLPADALDDGHRIIGAPGPRQLVVQAFDAIPGFLEERFLVPRALKACEPASARWLKQAVRHLLDVGGWMPDELIFAPAESLPLHLRDRMAAVVPSKFRGLVPATETAHPGLDMGLKDLKHGHTLVINTGGEFVGQLAAMAQQQPAWAAFALLESLFVDDDSRLAAIAGQWHRPPTGQVAQ